MSKNCIENYYESLKKEHDPNEIIFKVLLKLKENLEKNEIFLSEADFQFSFAKALSNIYPNDNIILEYPILTKNLYDHSCIFCRKSFKDKFENSRSFIDLYFKHNKEDYFIEFKYKLHALEHNIDRYDEKNFEIKSQLATNIGRHQLYEDIERMENIIRHKNNKCKAFVIFITNDHVYWDVNTSEDENRSDCNFYLVDGHNNYCKCDKGLKYKGGKKKQTEDNSEKEYSRRSLYVQNQYKLKWVDFKCIPNEQSICNNGKFRVLVIDCNNPEPK